MIHYMTKLFLMTCAAWLALSPPLGAQALKSTKVCRVEYRKNQAAIRKAKEKRRDFLAACRKTPVGQDTPIGDAATPTAEAPSPPEAPSPSPPPASPAPAQPAPAPSADEPSTSTAPAKPPEAEAPQTDAKGAAAPAPADPAPVENHSLPGWWNWTMWLSAAAALLVAGFFAVRGLLRIKKTGR